MPAAKGSNLSAETKGISNTRLGRQKRFMLQGFPPAILFLGILLVAHFTYSADVPVVSWEGETMGSVYTVKIVDVVLGEQGAMKIREEVEVALKEVNRQMSHYQTNSELSRFNRAPANQPFPVSSEFAGVVRLALELNRRSEGAFEATLAPVINLWGFGEKSDLREVPPEARLREAFARTGSRHLSITPRDELVKDIPGLEVNLSAIAKGFGVDAIAKVLRRHGFTNIYASISGEVFAAGHNPKKNKWQIGVSAPVSNWRPGDPMVAVLSISGQAVSTSGDYQKFFFDAQGRRLCHVMDPKTGRPVQHNLGSVTVVADNCTIADSLSTTLFVLGPEKGLKFIEGCTNAAALFVVRENDGSFRQITSTRFERMTGYTPQPPAGNPAQKN